jgi:hypothetical protein
VSGESLLLQTELARARAVHEAIESWRPEGPAEAQARGAEEVLDVFEATAAEMERLFRTEYERAVRGSADVEQLRHTRACLAEAFSHVEQAVRRFDLGVGHLAQNGGHFRAGAERLEKVRAAVALLRERLDEEWPVCSEAEAGEALRAAPLDAADAFAQIAGVDRAEWLRRVEEHKRRAGG